jgi:uncharacterized RDD family membrane protein YckC
MGTGVMEQLSPRQFCSECGRDFPAQDLARFGNIAVCADCKPGYVQRMREGVPSAARSAYVYGGFWIRFAAIILDGIILNVIFAILAGIAYLAGFFRPATSAGWQLGAIYLVLFGVSLAYDIYFLTQKGATPGKMAMGLKVITANGGPITAGRAIGRYFARLVSQIILYIGFIMAGFDDEKRALHDRLCDTRVIRN